MVCLATGAVGLVLMGVGGLAHGAHAGHVHAGHGHAGHMHVGAGHTGHVLGTHGRASGMGARGARLGGGGWRWTALLSPRLLFSLLVGFGVGGIAGASLGEPLRLAAATASAVVFEAALVGPLWRFLFRFESREALTLESAIEDEGRAVTGFDANGNGLVALDVDGQVVQLLATLAPDERARGVRIRSGDIVRIAEVDAARGRCTVTSPTR